MSGMSEKVQIEIQDSDDEDLAAEPAASQEQNPQSPLEDESQPEPVVDDLAEKLQSAECRAEESYDRLLRVSAEFDNYKKRTAREMQDVVRYANEKMAKELLVVVDNLERAIEAAGAERTEDDPLVKGIHLTLSEVFKILERHKIQPVKALGEPFDPAYHQAMMQEEVEDQPSNTVVREMQKGYTMHDRLLRPSMVVVSKRKAKTAEEGQTE
jgi:molecular chaperone GrpE